MNLLISKKRTFQSEDKRKDKLFAAWNEFLLNPNELPDPESFIEFYEGVVRVSDITSEYIGVELDDGSKSEQILISREISAFTCRQDQLFVVLGRQNEEWWPLEVISIASEVRGRKSGIHFSVNPMLRVPTSLGSHRCSLDTCGEDPDTMETIH